MSRFLNMGLTVQEVVAALLKTCQIHSEKDLGHLSVGAEADVAIHNLRKGTLDLLMSEANE